MVWRLSDLRDNEGRGNMNNIADSLIPGVLDLQEHSSIVIRPNNLTPVATVDNCSELSCEVLCVRECLKNCTWDICLFECIFKFGDD